MELHYTVEVQLAGYSTPVTCDFSVRLLPRPAVGWRVVLDEHAEAVGIMSDEPFDLAAKVP